MLPRRVHGIEMSQREENESDDCERGDRGETKSSRQRQLAEIFRPILTASKLMGQYFGETSLGEGSNQRTWIVSYISCALVVLGQWLIVAFGVTSLIYVGFSSMNAFFFLLVNTAWYIQCAGNTIACLSVLPLTSKRRSKFAKFLSSFVTASPKLDGMKKKALMGLAIACLAAVLNAIVIVLFSVRSSGIISVFPPWNRHPGMYLTVRVMVLVFGTLDSFAMTLPPLIFCITCILLEKMFCTLHNEVSQESDHSFTVASLRQEHLKLCEVVELANSVFSPLLFVIISLDIPLMCVNFYQLIKRSSEAETIEMLGYVYWNVCLSTLLVVIFTFGNRVNEKVSLQPSVILLKYEIFTNGEHLSNEYLYRYLYRTFII